MKSVCAFAFAAVLFAAAGAELEKNILKNTDFVPSKTQKGLWHFKHWLIPYHGGIKTIEPDKGWKGANSVKITCADTPGPETQMMTLQRLKKGDCKPGRHIFSVNAKLDRKVRRLSLIMGMNVKGKKFRTFLDRSYFPNEQAEPGQWRTYVMAVDIPEDGDGSKNIAFDFRVWNAKAASVWFDSPKLVREDD